MPLDTLKGMLTEGFQSRMAEARTVTPNAAPSVVGPLLKMPAAEVASNPSDEEEPVTPKGVEQLKKDESLQLRAYPDAHGFSVGYGFFLSNPESRNLFKQATGLQDKDFDAVAARKTAITAEQANKLLEVSLRVADKDARSVVKDFDSHPTAVQDALTNMAYNLGRTRLGGFVNTLADINAKRYEAAAERLKRSKWASQVGGRAKRIIEELKTAAAAASDVVDVVQDQDGNLTRVTR